MDLRRLYRAFSARLGSSLIHPQCFSKRFLEGEVRRRARSVSGLVLDVGCGFSPYRDLFHGAQYLGLDYPSNLGQDARPELDAYADAASLPVRGNSVDVVLCTQVLEHVADPGGALAEIARVLRPDRGLLLLSVPFLYPLHDEPFDYFRFTPHGLSLLLGKAGLTVREIVPQGGYVALAGELLNLFLLHRLERLSRNRFGRVAALLLAPVVLALAALVNVVASILGLLDRDRRFVMNYFVVAKRAES